MIAISGSNGFVGKYVIKEWLKTNLIEYVQWNQAVHGTILDLKNVEKFLIHNNVTKFLFLAWCDTKSLNYDQNQENLEFAEACLRILNFCTQKNIYFYTLTSPLAWANQYTKYGEAKLKIENAVLSYEKGAIYVPGFLYSLEDKRPRIMRQIFDDQTFFLREPNKIVEYLDVRDCAIEISSTFFNSLVGKINSKKSKQVRNSLFVNQVKINANSLKFKSDYKLAADELSYTELLLN